MALSDHGQYSGVVDIARNGIDEVIRLKAQAKQDEALIRQLVAELEGYRRNHREGAQATGTDSSGAAQVDYSYAWRPIDDNTPRGTKLQLISRRDGVATYGHLGTDAGFWTHWAPLPTFRTETTPCGS